MDLSVLGLIMTAKLFFVTVDIDIPPNAQKYEVIGEESIDEKDIVEENLNALVTTYLAPMLSKYLRKALRDRSIEKFIPYQHFSTGIVAGVFEIAIYHDKKLYDKIYLSQKDKGLIMAPEGKLRWELEKRYCAHGFTSLDDIWYSNDSFDDAIKLGIDPEKILSAK